MTATARHFHSAHMPTARELLLLPLNEAIDVVVGDTATKLVRPDNAEILVMVADTEDWLVKPGDHDSAFPSDPSSTTTGVTAGNAPWKITEGNDLVINAPAEITVKGATAGSKLRYYWV